MTNYAIINSTTGLVENSIIWDGQEDWAVPDGYEAVETEDASIGWSYSNGKFTAPSIEPPSADEVLAANTATLTALSDLAVSAMTPLLLSLQLGNATADEMASAQAWQAYSRALDEVNLTEEHPLWPETPE